MGRKWAGNGSEMDQKGPNMRYISNIDNKPVDIEWKQTETSKEVMYGTGSGHKQTGSGQKWAGNWSEIDPND